MSPHLYLIFGEEDFLVEEAVRELTRQYAHYTTEWVDDATSMDEFYLKVATVTLFSPSKILLCKNLHVLSGKVSDADFKAFQKVCEAAIDGGHVLVLFCSGKSLDQRLRQIGYLKTVATLQEYKSFKDWEQDKVMAWMRQRIENAGYRIAMPALSALEEMGGTNLRHLAAEIDKLKVFIGLLREITLADVQAISAGNGATTYAFTEAFKQRDAQGVLSAYLSLIEHGDEPIKILGLLASTVRLYIQILWLLSQRMAISQVAQTLKKNPYYIEKLATVIRKKYTLEDLKSALYLLNAQDVGIKSGRFQSKLALEVALLRICGRVAA